MLLPIPFNFPVTLFLLGGVFCGIFSAHPAWLSWIFGVTLAVVRWRGIICVVRFISSCLTAPLNIFTFDDINVISIVSGSWKQCWSIFLSSPVPENDCDYVDYNLLAERKLIEMAQNSRLRQESNLLLIGSATAEEALFLQTKTGCKITCVDTDIEKVCVGNDAVSSTRGWSSIRILHISTYDDLPFEDGIFDHVWIIAPLIWLRREHVAPVIHEALRVLRPEGAFLFTGLFLKINYGYLASLYALLGRQIPHAKMEDSILGLFPFDTRLDFQDMNQAAFMRFLKCLLFEDICWKRKQYLGYTKMATTMLRMSVLRFLISKNLLQFVEIWKEPNPKIKAA